MMFWGRGGAATTSATAHTDGSRRPSLKAEVAVARTVPAAPSYVLSEQRRSELLLAARTNRVSWVDGVDERSNKRLPVGPSEFPGTLAASSIPSRCRDALEGVSAELSTFFSSLDELKHKILANEMQLTEEEPQADEAAYSTARSFHTLLQELREQETLLDQWQRSHSPRTKKLTGHDREMAFLVAFRELVALLKNAQAAELVYRIQSFVKRAELWDLPLMLRAIATRDRPGGKVQDFVTKLVEQIKHSKKLRTLLQGDDAGDEMQNFLHVRDAYGVDLLHEVLEAFLMEKLYAKTLTPSREVASQDEAFQNRISLLGFVTFKHLDLPVPMTQEQEQTWLRLAKQLEAMTMCPSPRRKMDGVLRVCQDLTTFLKAQNGGRFPSADEFLPALIYVVLRANPSELKRNVAFILEYRNPTKLVSEPGYFFTHLVSSVAFLEEVNGSSLTISPEDFDEGLRRSKESLRIRGVRREIDHEVASNASSGSTSEIINGSANALQKERRGQMLPSHTSDFSNENEGSLRLPTVLEVRARRLSLVVND
ncbi:vacuolar protein sorting-associated protein 9 [Phytophthora pseudosyringae]|uniref:Vacuolar protein sorting-associated protein 9 n=1 Tax=Phytophthora pseudosyringae TaxID=221518 RepID=A0A8T1VKN4_9STRA|nr:vacuolar protein sorting-associated protein 9 [Phytophthora pseudosyringae]